MNIFVNLPCADVERSRKFYTELGWSINETFSDENAICVVVEKDKCLMLLRRDYYATFIGEKSVGDAKTTSLALVAFDLDSKQAVDDFIERALGAGGSEGPNQDLGFMYQRQFDDPDGNHFEPFWMDPASAPPQ